MSAAAQPLNFVIRVDGKDALATLKLSNDELKEFARRLAEAGKNSLPPLVPPSAERNVKGANQALLSLSRGLNDATQFQYGFAQGTNAVANNLEGLIYGFQQLKAQSAAAGTTMRATLLATLTGPAGILLGLTALTTAIPLASKALEGLFESSAAKAQAAKEAYQEAAEAALTFELDSRSFTVKTVEEADRLKSRLEQKRESAAQRIIALQRSLNDLLAIKGVERSEQDVRAMERTRATLVDLTAQQEVYRNALQQIANARASLAGSSLVAQAALEAGIADDDQVERQEDLATATEKLADAYAALGAAQARASGASKSDSGEANVARLERELAALRESGAEEVKITEKRTELIKARTAVLNAETAERRRAATQAAAEQKRIAAELARVRADLTTETLASEVAREIAAAEQVRAERLRVAQLTAEDRRLIELAYQMEVGRIIAGGIAASEAEEQRHTDALAALEDARLRANGATQAEILRAQIARVDEEIAAEQRSYDEQVRLHTERLGLQAQLAEAEKAERQKAAQTDGRIDEARARAAGATETQILALRTARIRAALAAEAEGTDEHKRLLADLVDAEAEAAGHAKRIAKERYDDILREVERHTDAVVGVLSDAVRQRREISDEEVSLTRERYEQEERDLERSLRNREISHAEYDLRRRELEFDRGEFEKRVEEDRTSFGERAVRGLTDVIIAEGERQLAAFIARIIAEKIFATTAQAAAAGAAATTAAGITAAYTSAATLASIASFGGAAAAGSASVLASIATVKAGVAAMSAFDRGGYTGAGGRLEPAGIVHRGEFVMTKAATERLGVANLYALMAAAEGQPARALDLGPMPRHYDTGGLVAGSGSALDLSPLRGDLAALGAEMRRLNGEVARMKQSPAPVKIGDRQARQIGVRGEVEARRSVNRRRR